MTALRPLKPQLVVVDVNNLSLCGLVKPKQKKIPSYHHYCAGLSALKAWLGRGYTYRSVFDPGYDERVYDSEKTAVEQAITAGEIERSKRRTADEYILELARNEQGIVATGDHYRDWYEQGHEWMMEEARAVVPSYSRDRGWSWQWADYEQHIYRYFHTNDERFRGGPHLPPWLDDEFVGCPPIRTRVDTWRYWPEISLGLGLPDNRRWPPPGHLLRVHHVVRDLGLSRGQVFTALRELGMSKKYYSEITDDEATLLREHFGFDPLGYDERNHPKP